jgi:hypothetical protein
MERILPQETYGGGNRKFGGEKGIIRDKITLFFWFDKNFAGTVENFTNTSYNTPNCKNSSKGSRASPRLRERKEL